MTDISGPSQLRPLLDVARRAYPKGVPRRDYPALLDYLQWFMSERSLAIIVAVLVNADPAAVASDSAVLAALPAGAAKGTDRAIWRVRNRLDANGWGEVARDFDTKDLQARISPVPEQPDHMNNPLAVLRRAYPDGIPGAEYRPLLAALHKEMSIRALGSLVGAFTGRHYVAVTNDANGAASVIRGDRASHRDVDRVWVKLLDHGWIPELPLARYEEPGFIDQAVTALRRAYPRALAADDYLALIAALSRDIDAGHGPDYNPIAYMVSEAFPDLDPGTIWHDALALHQAGGVGGPPPAELQRVWQHLLSHGFLPSGGPGQAAHR